MKTHTSLKNQCGFSLVESMVSLIVIAVGLLGLSGMQMASIKGTSNAHYRTTATLMALSIADRMRANKAGVNGNFYNTNDATIKSALNCGTPLAKKCDASGECSAKETAMYDINEVMCGTGMSGASTSFINGKLSIVCLNRTPGAAPVAIACGAKIPHEITISWDETNINKDVDTTKLKSNGMQAFSIKHEVIVL